MLEWTIPKSQHNALSIAARSSPLGYRLQYAYPNFNAWEFRLSNHPANLLLRFTLEIVSLVTIGQWAWNAFAGWQQYLFVVGIPFCVAVVWGLFGVPDDPMRNRKSMVAIPGRSRFALETFIFLLAIILMINLGNLFLAIFFSVALFFNYLWSADRLIWLIRS